MQKSIESQALAHPPSTDQLARLIGLPGRTHRICVEAAQKAISELRSSGTANLDDYVNLATNFLVIEELGDIRRVINMSGVILHTALGRAVLCESASKALALANHHVSLEIDLKTGKRGDRQEAVRSAILKLTGAEDCLVVNNCAAATMLVLRSLCQNQEVILARSQMVEIGGQFRLPDIICEAGSKLSEVGCTNRTRLDDYEKAITSESAAILFCHPSNYRIIGHTEHPSHRQLADLAHQNGILFIDDLGHGCLVDLTKYRLRAERTMEQAIRDGADLVLASGDKLIGGPQAGIILGKKETVGKISRHPMARAMRIDKLSLIALEKTLDHFLEDQVEKIPLYSFLAKSDRELKSEATKLKNAFGGRATLQRKATEVGGGTMPGEGIESWCVGFEAQSAQLLFSQLLQAPIPILGRIEKDKVWLDVRSCTKQDIGEVVKFLKSIAPC